MANPLLIVVPIVLAGGAAAAYFFWPREAKADEIEPGPTPGPVPGPTPAPAPDGGADAKVQRPPNLSGMPMGYNAVMFHSPVAVCQIGHALGYNFSGKKPGDPGYGTPQVCDGITANTGLAWKDFQRDWNLVSQSKKYASSNIVGLVPVGYKDQRFTLRALEIASKQSSPWSYIVATVKAGG